MKGLLNRHQLKTKVSSGPKGGCSFPSSSPSLVLSVFFFLLPSTFSTAAALFLFFAPPDLDLWGDVVAPRSLAPQLRLPALLSSPPFEDLPSI
jgi:hypothetical protein